jgi:NADPH-dependent curcumin reductase CurA
MTAGINRQWRVARYPAPDELLSAEHFEWTTESVAEPAAGEFLVRTICLAPGPAQRGYLAKDHHAFFENVPIGEVMRGRGVGQIIESKHPDYQAGELFVGSLGWQDYSLQRPRGAEFVFSTKKVTNPVHPLSTELSVLGQAGATAYFGLLEAGQLQAGDNVLVSAAAGGVGSMACQIARLRGAKQVVGITGSAAKCRWLVDELGVTAAINYKTENVEQRIAELFPAGIDVFFDNVGGPILNAALNNLAMHARVALCGFIATDYATDPGPGPINYRNLVLKRARMQGFIVFDYWDRFAAAEQALRDWYAAGALNKAEDISEGLETMPAAVASLFTGGNTGVKICRVSPDPE